MNDGQSSRYVVWGPGVLAILGQSSHSCVVQTKDRTMLLELREKEAKFPWHLSLKEGEDKPKHALFHADRVFLIFTTHLSMVYSKKGGSAIEEGPRPSNISPSLELRCAFIVDHSLHFLLYCSAQKMYTFVTSLKGGEVDIIDIPLGPQAYPLKAERIAVIGKMRLILGKEALILASEEGAQKFPLEDSQNILDATSAILCATLLD